MYAHLLRGNRDIFVTALGGSSRAASGRPEAVADDERGEEVRLADSTCEADEQSGTPRCGAGGGKQRDREKYRGGTANSGRWAWPPSRTRSARQRWWRSSRRSTRRSSWGSATGSGPGVASMTRWMRSRMESRHAKSTGSSTPTYRASSIL